MIRSIVATTLTVTLFFGGATALAQQPNPGNVTPPANGGLVPCGNQQANNMVTDPCTWEKLIEGVQIFINFLIFKVAAPLAAVMFIYAGFLYVTNRGDEGQVKKAHEIFWAVFIGLVAALAAWLMVSFILRFFLGDGSDYNFLG